MEKGIKMQQAIEIKGKVFGTGRPVVCVPVVEAEKESIIEKIRTLTEKKVEMIEWRVDMFREAADAKQVKEILTRIKPMLSDTVFLFTFRTRNQGGCSDLEEKKILYLNELAAKSGCVDIVDLEFFEATKPQKEIRRFQKMGVRILASHHDFEETPQDGILKILMDQMQAGGADLAKLAVMPKSAEDVLRLLHVTLACRKRFPQFPVVTIAMGAFGVISRLCGEAFGSCITFGADGKASAPGQIDAETLSNILDVLHESMEEGN